MTCQTAFTASPSAAALDGLAVVLYGLAAGQATQFLPQLKEALA